MHDFEAAQRKQEEAAAERVAAATDSRREKIDEIRKNGEEHEGSSEPRTFSE